MFIHRMALELHMPVGELKIRMTAMELFAWAQYFAQLEQPQEMAALTPDQLRAAMG